MIVMDDDEDDDILIIDPERFTLLQAAAKRGYTCHECQNVIPADDAPWVLESLGSFYQHRENLQIAAVDFIDKLLGHLKPVE